MTVLHFWNLLFVQFARMATHESALKSKFWHKITATKENCNTHIGFTDIKMIPSQPRDFNRGSATACSV